MISRRIFLRTYNQLDGQETVFAANCIATLGQFVIGTSVPLQSMSIRQKCSAFRYRSLMVSQINPCQFGGIKSNTWLWVKQKSSPDSTSTAISIAADPTRTPSVRFYLPPAPYRTCSENREQIRCLRISRTKSCSGQYLLSHWGGDNLLGPNQPAGSLDRISRVVIVPRERPLEVVD
jgi:hypothetical protein